MGISLIWDLLSYLQDLLRWVKAEGNCKSLLCKAESKTRLNCRQKILSWVYKINRKKSNSKLNCSVKNFKTKECPKTKPFETTVIIT